MKSQGKGAYKFLSDPLGTIGEIGEYFYQDPLRNNPIYGVGSFYRDIAKASYNSDWQTVSYKLGGATTNVAVAGVSGGLGKATAGALAPEGFNFNLGFNQAVTTNGLLMDTQSLAFSASSASVATAGGFISGTLASQGIMFSNSQNNNDFSNKNTGKSSNNTSSGSSKTTSQGSSSGGVKGSVKTGNRFPENPDDLLPDISRPIKVKGNGSVSQEIITSDNLRIRAETHPLEPGETFNPRHHGQHYHVEKRLDPTKSWNNKNNVQKVYPPNYTPGTGTGFLPGEEFPK